MQNNPKRTKKTLTTKKQNNVQFNDQNIDTQRPTNQSRKQTKSQSKQNNENNLNQNQKVKETKKTENNQQNVPIKNSDLKQDISFQEQSKQKKNKPSKSKQIKKQPKSNKNKNSDTKEIKTNQQKSLLKEQQQIQKNQNTTQDSTSSQNTKASINDQPSSINDLVIQTQAQQESLPVIKEKLYEQYPLQMPQNITQRLKIQDYKNKNLPPLPQNENSSILQPPSGIQANKLQGSKHGDNQTSTFIDSKSLSRSMQNLERSSFYIQQKENSNTTQLQNKHIEASLTKRQQQSQKNFQEIQSLKQTESQLSQQLSSIDKDKSSSQSFQKTSIDSQQNQKLQMNQDSNKNIQILPSDTQTIQNITQNGKDEGDENSVEASISITKTKVQDYILSSDTQQFIQDYNQNGYYKIKNQFVLNNLQSANLNKILNSSYSSQKSQSQLKQNQKIQQQPSKISKKPTDDQLKQSIDTNNIYSSQNSFSHYLYSSAVSPDSDLYNTIKSSKILSPLQKSVKFSDGSDSMLTNSISESSQEITVNETDLKNKIQDKIQEQQNELQKLQQEGKNYQSTIFNQIKKMNNNLDEIKQTLVTENSQVAQTKLLSESKCDSCIINNNKLNDLQERIQQLERFISINEKQRKKIEKQNNQSMNLINQVESIIMENHINQANCRISCNIF